MMPNKTKNYLQTQINNKKILFIRTRFFRYETDKI